MTNNPVSLTFLLILSTVTVALFAGLGRYGPWLAREIRAGIDASHSSRASAKLPRPFADELSGVSARFPEGVTAQLSGLGVMLKRDADGMKAALVCPLVADRSIAPGEVLTGVHAVWSVGMKESGDSLTLGMLHDEGTMVHASLESGRGIEAIAGELRVRRAPPGMRVEAFWTAKDEFDRERAPLEALVKSVEFAPPRALPVKVGQRHQAALPPGYRFVEDEGGIEVISEKDDRLAFGLATGKGHGGMKKSEQLIEHYLTRSQGLTNPTTGLTRAYPTIDCPTGQTWDIAARDLEYEAAGRRVRAVITAALTAGPRGEAFLLSVRQAPPEQWADAGFTLSAIESTARFFPRGLDAPGLAIPISHPESTWELLEGWAVGRAMRSQGTPRWREAMLPTELRISPRTGARWALSPWLAQPDGTYADPADPLELLSPLAP